MRFVLVAASRAYLSTERWFYMKKLCFQWDRNMVNGASWGLTSWEETDLHVQTVWKMLRFGRRQRDRNLILTLQLFLPQRYCTFTCFVFFKAVLAEDIQWLVVATSAGCLNSLVMQRTPQRTYSLKIPHDNSEFVNCFSLVLGLYGYTNSTVRSL